MLMRHLVYEWRKGQNEMKYGKPVSVDRFRVRQPIPRKEKIAHIVGGLAGAVIGGIVAGPLGCVFGGLNGVLFGPGLLLKL